MSRETRPHLTTLEEGLSNEIDYKALSSFLRAALNPDKLHCHPQMASEISASPALDPQLYQEWDDEEDLRIKAPLEKLINGTQSSLQAAQEIDAIVRDITGTRLQKLIDFAKSHKLSDEDYADDATWNNLAEPRASVYAVEIIGHYARISSAFSPYSVSKLNYMRT